MSGVPPNGHSNRAATGLLLAVFLGLHALVHSGQVALEGGDDYSRVA